MAGNSSLKEFWSTLRHAFAIPEEQPLSSENLRWLEQIAEKVVRRGLAMPAVFLLQSSKPLSFVGSQVLVFFKPLISVIFPPAECDRVIALLARRDVMATLASLIEDAQRPASQVAAPPAPCRPENTGDHDGQPGRDPGH